MNVTKLELCNRVAKRFYNGQLSSVTEYKEILEAFFDEIFATMAEGYRIEIRGLGCFRPATRKKRKGRNPRSGELYEIPEYVAPTFKFSKEAQKVFEEKLTAHLEKIKDKKTASIKIPA